MFFSSGSTPTAAESVARMSGISTLPSTTSLPLSLVLPYAWPPLIPPPAKTQVQAAGHQAALAKSPAAVSVAHRGRLFAQVERFGRRRIHQLQRPLIDGLMCRGRRAAVVGDKLRLECPPQIDAAGELRPVHRGRQ